MFLCVLTEAWRPKRPSPVFSIDQKNRNSILRARAPELRLCCCSGRARDEPPRLSSAQVCQSNICLAAESIDYIFSHCDDSLTELNSACGSLWIEKGQIICAVLRHSLSNPIVVQKEKIPEDVWAATASRGLITFVHFILWLSYRTGLNNKCHSLPPPPATLHQAWETSKASKTPRFSNYDFIRSAERANKYFTRTPPRKQRCFFFFAFIVS